MVLGAFGMAAMASEGPADVVVDPAFAEEDAGVKIEAGVPSDVADSFDAAGVHAVA